MILRTLFFVTVVASGVYLAATQSSTVNQWLNETIGHNAESVAYMAKNLKNNLQDKLTQLQQAGQNNSAQIAALTEQLNVLQNRLEAIQQSATPSPTRQDALTALPVAQQAVAVDPAPTDTTFLGDDTVNGVAFMDPQERSQALMDLIMRMQMRAAGH